MHPKPDKKKVKNISVFAWDLPISPASNNGRIWRVYEQDDFHQGYQNYKLSIQFTVVYAPMCCPEL